MDSYDENEDENINPNSYATSNLNQVMEKLPDQNLGNISESSQSVNESVDSDKSEIDIEQELKGSRNNEFKRNHVKSKYIENKMMFQDYFVCRTQRVQLKPETEEKGKLLFGEYLNK